MRESETSSMENEKARIPPAMMFAMMSGTTMRRTDFRGGAPRFCAASSSEMWVCSKPAETDRTTYGNRRIM